MRYVLRQPYLDELHSESRYNLPNPGTPPWLDFEPEALFPWLHRPLKRGSRGFDAG